MGGSMAKKNVKNERDRKDVGFYPADIDYSRHVKKLAGLLNAPSKYLNVFSDTTPDIDLVENDKEIRLKVDLPGIKKEDIKVTVNRDNVVVSARSASNHEEKGENYYYRERSSSGFYRNVSLPSPVNSKNAKAKFENGTLELTLAKAKPEGSNIRIE